MLCVHLKEVFFTLTCVVSFALFLILSWTFCWSSGGFGLLSPLCLTALYRPLAISSLLNKASIPCRQNFTGSLGGMAKMSTSPIHFVSVIIMGRGPLPGNVVVVYFLQGFLVLLYQRSFPHLEPDFLSVKWRVRLIHPFV